MNEHISKAQREVWDWKNELHNEIKDMELEKGIEYLLKKVELVAHQCEQQGLLKRRTSEQQIVRVH
ncbi:MAG: hypothetical protein HY960_12140 [Ignavibacteriae bacterium]|nr:hypothetical protein [Ignavibacteriota bacterium]